MIARVEIQSRLRPYCTAIAGPTSHSPPPMEDASRIAPGPITRKTFRTENGGAPGRSRTSQAGRAFMCFSLLSCGGRRPSGPAVHEPATSRAAFPGNRSRLADRRWPARVEACTHSQPQSRLEPAIFQQRRLAHDTQGLNRRHLSPVGTRQPQGPLHPKVRGLLPAQLDGNVVRIQMRSAASVRDRIETTLQTILRVPRRRWLGKRPARATSEPP